MSRNNFSHGYESGRESITTTHRGHVVSVKRARVLNLRSSRPESVRPTFVDRVKLWEEINVADEEKLRILQQFDPAHPWFTLDEKRLCTVCGRIISGYEIQVIGRTHESEPLRLACPTKHCRAFPLDWVTP